MIEVTVSHPSGLCDCAEADDLESAMLAARTLFDELCEANPYQGFHRNVNTTLVVLDAAGEVFSVQGVMGVRP